MLGGHTILRHVGKSDAFLQRRLLLERIPAASTFSSVQAAEKIVNATLSSNAAVVELVQSGVIKDPVAITSEFNKAVGRVWVRGANQPVATNFATVVIVHAPWTPDRLLVISAFPSDPAERFP
ncbi:MAG: hypothetical protein KJS97_10435 [Alphaproteobacteria bacterium]|nr:hypothetical protein [Alphaproteobacteria bacterium]